MKTTFYPLPRRTTLVFSSILVSTLLAAFLARADWIAEGRQISWKMEVPNDWVGGNYDLVRRVIESNPTDSLSRFFETFLPSVKDSDAMLWHLRDLQSLANSPSSFSTLTLTTIRISIALLPSSEPIVHTEEEIRFFFQVYAGGLRDSASAGESVTLVETSRFFVDLRDAHEATFRIAMPNQGGSYTVLLLVPDPKGSLHTFRLDVDSTRFPQRRDEFHSMLRTLRYLK